MSRPRVHRSAPRKRDIRAAKEGSARDAIGTIEPGCEVFCLTFGQFSLIDALVVLLEQTGPADVILSTWTAAHADLSETQRLLRAAQMTGFRIILDHNMMRRPNAAKLVADILERFGADAVRTTASHAKFIAIRNERWSLAVRTSMNLNANPRMENIEISDDPALCGFLESVAGDLFESQAPGDFSDALPELQGIPTVERAGKVRMGQVAKGLTTPLIGRWPGAGTP